MRTREEILKHYNGGYAIENDMLEVLLDIRDSLTEKNCSHTLAVKTFNNKYYLYCNKCGVTMDSSEKKLPVYQCKHSKHEEIPCPDCVKLPVECEPEKMAESIQIEAITEKDGMFYIAIKTNALKEDLEVVTQRYISDLLTSHTEQKKEELIKKIELLRMSRIRGIGNLEWDEHNKKAIITDEVIDKILHLIKEL